MNIRKLLGSRDFKLFLLVFFLNLFLILFIYKSVFSLEFQGDGWQYAWGHHVYYKNVFSQESLKGMRTSLGGASLTFGLIENNFGLNPLVFYSISVILKFLSVLVFYFLVKRLTGKFLPSLIATLLLSATFAGIEATHWVFNMYAYIGLIFIMLSILIGIDQPVNYSFKRWLASFLFASAGIWYATMRTNGIIPLILAWSIYKVITLKSKSSVTNLISWIVGLTIFISVDKLLLGQMESDYSSKYIIGAGLQAFQSQIAASKYDFILSSFANLGIVMLPDVTWASINFPKIFSFFGETPMRFVILPFLLIFAVICWILSSLFAEEKKTNSWIKLKFIPIFLLGMLWSLIVLLISKLGPLNLSSWVTLAFTLFGGYFAILCLSLIFIQEVPGNLKDLFFLAFFWFFVFLLLPLFQNGGVILGTYHRYMATTAPSVPLFMAGLLTLVFKYKNEFARISVLLIVILMFFSHAVNTKAFFDRKASVHSRTISDRVWHQLLKIIPNKPDYRDNPPTMFFASADNPLDQETLFESVYFGLGFRFGVDYNWRPDHVGAIYNQGDYLNLVKDVKKNPKLLDDFYAVMIQNQNLFDITKQVKEKLTSDIVVP